MKCGWGLKNNTAKKKRRQIGKKTPSPLFLILLKLKEGRGYKGVHVKALNSTKNKDQVQYRKGGLMLSSKKNIDLYIFSFCQKFMRIFEI